MLFGHLSSLHGDVHPSPASSRRNPASVLDQQLRPHLSGHYFARIYTVSSYLYSQRSCIRRDTIRRTKLNNHGQGLTDTSATLIDNIFTNELHHNLVRVFLFRSFLLSALVFSVMEPITILWSLPMLTRFMTVTSVTMLGLSVMM